MTRKQSSARSRFLSSILAASLMSAPLATPSVFAAEPNTQETSTTIVKAAGIPPAVDAVAKLLLALGVSVALFSTVSGFVWIPDDKSGVVIKRFAWNIADPAKRLQQGSIIALNGEAGIQAALLMPGIHFGYWPWQFTVEQVPNVTVPADEIYLVFANDGLRLDEGQMLGKHVVCDRFQNAEQFLRNGGQRGRQRVVLKPGTYRINTKVFDVVSPKNASKHGVDPDALHLRLIPEGKQGVVTTLDGLPLRSGEIAGPRIEGHQAFQDAETFIQNGGSRGLQDEVLRAGEWFINPWFASVVEEPQVEVSIGYVGVVISFIDEVAPNRDQAQPDLNPNDFIVPVGQRGVWQTPLSPGKHPLNTRTHGVQMVPVTNIVLNWNEESSSKSEHGYDNDLRPLKLRTRDGFSITVEVAQVINIRQSDAAGVIAQMGSIANMVTNVLEPLVNGIFRDVGQQHSAMEFLLHRDELRALAGEKIREKLQQYNIQAIDTVIGHVSEPEKLMEIVRDRELAERAQETLQVQADTETRRLELNKQRALADVQPELVKQQYEVQLAKLRGDAQEAEANGAAKATITRSSADAEGIRKVGLAQAAAYQAGIDALGEGYTTLQLWEKIANADTNLRLVPEVLVTGNGGSGGNLTDALVARMLIPPKASASEEASDVG